MASPPDPKPWVITASILLAINTVLFFVWMWEYYFLHKKKNEEDADLAKHYFHCKSIFFQTLLVLLLLRFCQYSLLLVLNLVDLPTSLSILFLDVTGVTAGLYLLVYATLLLFWFSFLKIISTRSLESVEKPYFYLFSAQVIVIFVVLSNMIISFYFYGTEREEAFFILQLVGFSVLLIAMAIGTLLAFILGYRVYGLFSKQNQILPKRSKQVAAISFVVTIMFIIRIVLMIYSFVPVFHGNFRPAQGEAYEWYYYSVEYLPYLLFFILGEDIPIAFLIVFQARLPKKNRQQLLFSMEAEEQPSLQEFMFP